MITAEWTLASGASRRWIGARKREQVTNKASAKRRTNKAQRRRETQLEMRDNLSANSRSRRRPFLFK